MYIPNLVGATQWPSNYGCGDDDRSKFIRCVDGRKPKGNEVCILGEDGVTIKFHPKARVDIGSGAVCKYTTNCLTEMGLRPLYFSKNPLMEVLSFSALLIH